MNTYQEFYEGEVRTLKLSIRDRDGQKFYPVSASASVMDSNSITVSSAGTSASVVNNEVFKLIDGNTTNTPGQYKIVWELSKDQHTYKHITELRVSKL